MSLTVHEKGILSSTMSDASVAMVLGRTVAWVVRRRGALLAENRDEGEGPGAAAPAAARVEAKPADRARAEARADPAPVAPAPVPAPAPPAAEALRDPATRRRGFVRRFLAAGWPLSEVAWLFDADAEQLAAEVWG